MCSSSSSSFTSVAQVVWFSKLPEEQLNTLASRARLEWCGRYRTIIREGGRGAYFYVLLQGQVHCTSQTKKGLSVRLGEGSSFGEGALVTTVQREATVTAIEPCQLMLLTSDDMEGLDVDLSSVMIRVISLVLETLTFFRDLTKQQHADLASVMEMAYFRKDNPIFEEGASGDAMYVLLEGKVEMRKRSADNQLIATFLPSSEQPWFGEGALMGSAKKRACAAVCADASKLLVVRSPHFSRFLEIVPTFQDMFISQAKAYATMEKMRHANESQDDVLNLFTQAIKDGVMGAFAFGGAGRDDDDDASDDGLAHRELSEEVLQRWRQLTTGAMSKARLDAASNAEEEELLPGAAQAGSGAPSDRDAAATSQHGVPAQRAGPTPGGRRVSYVAGVTRSAAAAERAQPLPAGGTVAFEAGA